MAALLHDLRYSVRSLWKHPVFVAAGVLVLGLGVGVNTAVFSVINAILFRDPPVAAPHDIRYVYTQDGVSAGPSGRTSYREFLELGERIGLFAGLTLTSALRDTVRVGSTASTAAGESVASNYFDLLGLKPFMGRAFHPEDDPPTSSPVAIISFSFWQSRFNSDPEVIGKTLDRTRAVSTGTYRPWQTLTIVGVAPRGFKGLASPWDATEFWVPFLQNASAAIDGDPRYRATNATDPRAFIGLPVGRLAPGVSDEQASAAVAAIGTEFRQRHHPTEREWSLHLRKSRHVRFPFDPRARLVPGRLAAAIMTVSGMLLLIAAANLAGMLMSRGVARRSEIALRLTLGATPWRLRRQFMTETLLLATGGGLLGLLVARWLVDLFIAGTPTQFVRWHVATFSLDVPIDARVLMVTAASCVAAAMLAGFVQTWHGMRVDLLSGLAAGSSGTTRPVRTRLRHWIVLPQICLSLVLLLTAGVLTRTLIRSELGDPGYRAERVALIDFEVPTAAKGPRGGSPEVVSREREARMTLNRRLLDAVLASPHVAAASMTMTTPVSGLPLASMNTWVVAADRFRPDARHYWTTQGTVATGFFETLEIPVLRGRTFDTRDGFDSSRVAVVSEDLARAVWPGQDPLGQRIGRHWPEAPNEPQWMEVIGVVRNTVPPLSEASSHPTIYTPLEQDPVPGAFTLIARGSADERALMDAMKSAVTGTEPSALAIRARTLETAVGEILYPRRVAAAILVLAAVIGLTLASAGLYGVVSYSVEQRLREIGVRMALGADRRDITWLIVGEGLRVSAAGLVLGFMLTFAGIRLTSHLVIAIPAMDAVTFCAVPLLLGSVIVIASYLPALRAARIDPIEVLRAN